MQSSSWITTTKISTVSFFTTWILLLLLSQQRPNPAGERLTLSVLPSLPWANLFAMMALGFCESKQGCGITRARELKLQTEKAESVLCSIEPVFWRFTPVYGPDWFTISWPCRFFQWNRAHMWRAHTSMKCVIFHEFHPIYSHLWRRWNFMMHFNAHFVICCMPSFSACQLSAANLTSQMIIVKTYDYEWRTALSLLTIKIDGKYPVEMLHIVIRKKFSS